MGLRQPYQTFKRIITYTTNKVIIMVQITIDNYFETIKGLSFEKVGLRHKYFEFHNLMCNARNCGGIQSWINGSESFNKTISQNIIDLNNDIYADFVIKK